MPKGEDFQLNVLKWIEKNSIEGFNLETNYSNDKMEIDKKEIKKFFERYFFN